VCVFGGFSNRMRFFVKVVAVASDQLHFCVSSMTATCASLTSISEESWMV
jgi:hypothetical protein